MVDVWGGAAEPRRLTYRPARADTLLGYAVPAAEQATLLRRLECAVGEKTGEWAVTPPSFRPDIEREVDLIEEVGRLAGYRMAPETLPSHTTAGGLTGPQQVRRALRRALAGCGLDEVITYAFIGADALDPLGLPEGDPRLEPVRLANPMSAEQSVMRTILLPGLIATVRDNLDRLNDPPNLFELGRVYLWDEPTAAPEHAAEPGAVLPHEAEAVGIVMSGPVHPENWTGLGRPTDFFTLKGVVEVTLRAVGLEATYAPLDDQAGAFPYLHPGKAAVVSVPGAGGVGVLGMLRPDAAAAYGVEGLDLYVASLNTDRIAAVAQPTVTFRDLVTYPPAEQDLAVVVDGGVPAADVVAAARKAGGKLVAGVTVFDVYEGDQVPEGKRSLALRVLMRSAERTLNDKDIATVRARIVGALEREFGATLR